MANIIISQSKETSPLLGINTTYPTLAKHLDKDGPIVLFSAPCKGVVVESGRIKDNDGKITEYPLGTFSDTWTVFFKEYFGTIVISNQVAPEKATA